MQPQTCSPLRIWAATNNAAVLWAPIPAHETGTGVGHVTQFPWGNHIYRPWTLQGRIWNSTPLWRHGWWCNALGGQSWSDCAWPYTSTAHFWHGSGWRGCPSSDTESGNFDLMYFLDWNSEFQPLSICVTTLCLAKSADITGTLPASTRVDTGGISLYSHWIYSDYTTCILWI
jgi:hypothetical protein